MDSEFQIHKLIGEGSFGKVYKAQHISSNNFVAYKVVTKTGRIPSEVEALRKECEIQKYLQHPNIIRMLGSFENSNELVVITEFADKDLCQFLKEEKVLSESIAKRIVGNLVSALQYLHSYRILHRDLKPQNVLLDSAGTAKICDFGFAKVLGCDNAVSIKGTPLYMAPELMSGIAYDHNADLWSLGCIVYELVYGRPPYTTSSIVLLIKMIREKPIEWPSGLSQVCLSFLQGLLQKDPRHRLSWPYLLHHPFIHTPELSTNTMTFASAVPFQPHIIAAPVPIYNHPNLGLNAQVDLNARPIINFEKSTNNRAQSKQPSHDVHHCSVKCQNTNENNKMTVQKEEWLAFLQKTIRSIMYKNDVEVLTEKHSLKMITNALIGCNLCPIIIATISKLLSLPFVMESVSECNLNSIRQAFVHCRVLKELLDIAKTIIVEKTDTNGIIVCYESGLEQIFVLICNLVYSSDTAMIDDFVQAAVSLKFFNLIKDCLAVRLRRDRYSVVKYVIAILLRSHVHKPECQELIAEGLEKSLSEIHSLLREFDDLTVHPTLCTLLTMICSTRPHFMKKSNGVLVLIEDLTILKNNVNVSTTQHVVERTLTALERMAIRTHD